MKLYLTKSIPSSGMMHEALASSEAGASKERTRLKKLGHTNIITTEIEVTPTRSGIIEFYNKRHAATE